MSDKSTSGEPSKSPSLTLHIGHEELVIRQRYEVLSIVNDLLIGTWFIIGSILFFYESLAYIGTWLFLIGSIEMMIRPLIRLARRVHIKRLHPEAPAAVDAGHDY
ncbi:YrhK family protein [Halomonas litopenaei]|uniref:YrhK family protein n=1 Tax=Halomonas litopenaei TaxID=2109328 RepID=UPI003F9F581D